MPEPSLTCQHTTESESSLSTAVIEAVSEASDTASRDLPPLHEVVDPDALNDLFKPQLMESHEQMEK